MLRKLFKKESTTILATPAILWQVVFLYIPVIGILVCSFIDFKQMAFTLRPYLDLLDAVYIKVVYNSLILGTVTSVLTLLLAYPVAYYLALKVRRWKSVLLFLLIMPSWANFIVQVYAWFFLLERQGIISMFIHSFGFTAEPPHLLNNYFSIFLGMTQVFLPFMIFPIYVALERMDKRLLEASADLGASWPQTFFRVVLPLSKGGIYTGLLLVFIPAFGEFAIPALLGGSKTAFWGTVIVDKFLLSRDWAAGFALASAGVGALLSVMLFAYVLIIGYRRVIVPRKNSQLREEAQRYITHRDDVNG